MKRLTCFGVAVALWTTLSLAIAQTVPTGTELRVRLQESLSTNDNRVGDRFTATVVTPSQYEGAVVHGQISNIKKSGTLTGRTEMRLKFTQMQLRNGSTFPMSADIVQVYNSDRENVKSTSEEGTVESGKQSSEAVKRGTIGAAAGAVIGGLSGGGKGAAIGAIIGGAAGTGSLAVTGKKELKLGSGTEMLIRVTGAS